MRTLGDPITEGSTDRRNRNAIEPELEQQYGEEDEEEEEDDDDEQEDDNNLEDEELIYEQAPIIGSERQIASGGLGVGGQNRIIR
jgi:hypothetical protein